MSDNISKLEPKRATRVFNNRGRDDHGARISALEGRMSAVETAAKHAADNTDQILAVLNTAKSVGGFLSKHWPRAVAFVTGICLTAGVGNPAVMKFVATFFAG